MNDNKIKGTHAQGMIQLTADYGNIPVDYREHDARDGRLLVAVAGCPLDARQLLSLAEALTAAEETLRKGRERYAAMWLAHLSLEAEEGPSANPRP